MISPNTQTTERALAVLKRELVAADAGPNEILALVYVSKYSDRSGKALDGFRPGYGVTPWRADQTHGWQVVRLPDGTELPFFPMFKAGADTRFSIDLATEAFSLFSIDPVGTGAPSAAR